MGEDEEEEKKKWRAEAIQHMRLRALAAGAAGATGAAITTAIFFPVELVKCRLQASVAGKRGFVYDGLLHGIVSILRQEGPLGLFTGLRSVLFKSIVFDFATIFWGELLVLRLKAFSSSTSALWSLLLRTLGGWLTTALMLPLECITTRVTTCHPPKSATAIVQEVWSENGLRGFYRGLYVMLALCVNPALTFTAFDQLRGLLLSRLRLRAQRRQGALAASGWEEERQLSWLEAFCVGSIAKALTLVFVYPLIRAKFLLQARKHGSGVGFFQVLKEVAQLEGFGGLYRGLPAQLSKSLLSSALLLAVKERTELGWRALLLGA